MNIRTRGVQAVNSIAEARNSTSYKILLDSARQPLGAPGRKMLEQTNDHL